MKAQAEGGDPSRGPSGGLWYFVTAALKNQHSKALDKVGGVGKGLIKQNLVYQHERLEFYQKPLEV